MKYNNYCRNMIKSYLSFIKTILTNTDDNYIMGTTIFLLGKALGSIRTELESYMLECHKDSNKHQRYMHYYHILENHILDEINRREVI